MNPLPYEVARDYVAMSVLSEFPMAPMYRVIQCRYPAGLHCDYHNDGKAYNAIIHLSGQMVFQAQGGKTHCCERGTVVTIPPDSTIRWAVEHDAELVQFQHFGYELNAHGMLAHLFGPMQNSLASMEIAAEQVEHFERNLAMAKLSKAKDIALSVAGLEFMLAAVEASQELSKGKGGVPGNSPLEKCLNFIEANLNAYITLADLSACSNVSPCRISQLFMEKLAISPKRYIAKRKIELAQRLLSDGNLNVGEVADRLGFNSLSYFSRFFKRQTGRIPSKR